ncbi:MAG TPA: hypothetical protein VL147_09735 [Devosia sp.]|nr:hypothetical protein [Devosia sp.]
MKLIEKLPGTTLSSDEVAAIGVVMRRSAADPLAHALGHFILQWTFLETSVTILLRHLAETPDAFEYAVLAGQLDVYSKTKALLSLAGRRPRPKEWDQELKLFAKNLIGPLRDRRNRFVHDTWLVEERGITKFSYHPRPAKDGGPPSAIDEKLITIPDIEEATAQVYLAAMLLKKLDDELQGAKPSLSTENS